MEGLHFGLTHLSSVSHVILDSKTQSWTPLQSSLPSLSLSFNSLSFLAFLAFARMVGLACNCDAITHLETVFGLPSSSHVKFTLFIGVHYLLLPICYLAKLIPVKVQCMVLLL